MEEPEIQSRRVLLVDDEQKLLKAVSEALSAQQYTVLTAETGEEAFYLAYKEKPDLIVLDVSLPRCSGLDVLQQLRSAGLEAPVLLLTSHNTPEDRVSGLNAGADDYLGKPFSLPELLARIRALLRRRGAPAALKTAILAVEDLTLDTNARTAFRAQVPLELTAREFDLLEFLLLQKGRIVSREMLAQHIWRETARFTPINNVIDVQMARLRRKVDDPFPVRLIHTVRGVGFIVREDAP